MCTKLYHNPSRIYSYQARLAQHLRRNLCNLPHQCIKEENHIITLTGAEKSFDRLSYLFVTTYDPQKTKNKGKFPQFHQ
jgi:hypothetical protein